MAAWSIVRRHKRLFPENATHLVLRLDRDGGRHLVVQVDGNSGLAIGDATGRTALGGDGAGRSLVATGRRSG